MTLQDLGNIGEFVGAIGVIISLVYLATQIRQNTKSVRAAAVDVAADRFVEVNLLPALNPELSELLDAGYKDYVSLSDIQKRRFRSYLLGTSLRFENLFVKYRQGLLPDAQWEGIAEALQYAARRPGVRQSWKEIRPLLNPEFRKFYDAMVDDAAGE